MAELSQLCYKGVCRTIAFGTTDGLCTTFFWWCIDFSFWIHLRFPFLMKENCSLSKENSPTLWFLWTIWNLSIWNHCHEYWLEYFLGQAVGRTRLLRSLFVRYRLIFLEIGVDFYISATDFLEIEIYYNKKKFFELFSLKKELSMGGLLHFRYRLPRDWNLL